jgi:hypothetical protein
VIVEVREKVSEGNLGQVGGGVQISK